MLIHCSSSDGSNRRGSLLPATALAILVSGGCLALVLNEYWLTSIQEELRTATQSVALAGAQALANDDLLKLDVEEHQIADQAREIAARQSMRNFVAGPTLPRMDVHIGRITLDPLTGRQESVETDLAANSVLVVGHRDRSRNNPVMMLAPLLAGRSVADVTVTAEASISNLIQGVRAFDKATVPAWPMAILEVSSDSKVQTWTKEIEQHQGLDHFSWNADTQQVESHPDGLQEITLLPAGKQGNNNLYLVDIGNELQDQALERQFRDGWTAEDLAEFGEVFSFQPGPLNLPASQDFAGVPIDTLRTQIGQVRIVLLYSSTTGTKGTLSVQATRMVAARLMDVSRGSQGPQFIMQAAVVATRTAILDEEALYRGETQGNPYLYKLSITQ